MEPQDRTIVTHHRRTTKCTNKQQLIRKRCKEITQHKEGMKQEENIRTDTITIQSWRLAR